MNEYSKEELLAYLDAAIEIMREQFDTMQSTKEEHVVADRMKGGFAEIRRRIQVSP